MLGLSQCARRESQQIQLPFAQQKCLPQNGIEENGRQEVRGSEQRTASGSRWKSDRATNGRRINNLEYIKVMREVLECRYIYLPLPSIYSWGSGANPWGPEKDDVFSKPNHYDGMLEIVGVTGVVHLGQIQSGLRSATRIAQVNPNPIAKLSKVFTNI